MFSLESMFKRRTTRSRTAAMSRGEQKRLCSSRKWDEKQAILRLLATLPACSALQTTAELRAATTIVHWLGLRSHHDPQKNWDTLKCLLYILRACNQQSPILDAGSGSRSAILEWLHQLGFQNLYACDLKPVNRAFYERLGAEFAVQNITKTSYADSTFHAAVSISVIEHNIPVGPFLREMQRVLQPGGILLVSTDYWSEPIDCEGIYPYGEGAGKMKVFLPEELSRFVRDAEDAGFRLFQPLELGTKERVIRWDRVDREYTFAFLAFEKTAPQGSS